MNAKARATRTIHHTHAAARHTSRPLNYWTLSGRHAAHIATGRLITTSTFLDRVGGGDLPDGQKSWFGRHVAKAYRQATGTEPLRVWTQHRTTGRWIHVMVYGPIDQALYVGLRTYKGTRHLLAGTYDTAA